MGKDKYSRSVDKDSKGGGNFSIVNLPGHIKPLRYTKDGSYALDIIPYKIGGKHHPDVASKEADIGDEDYILDIMVHRDIGPKQMRIVCPRNYGKQCPICDHYDAVKAQYGWGSKELEAIKKFYPQRKALYFVCDPDNGEEVLFYEASYANFQKELLEEAKAAGREQGLECIPFAEWPKGCTVKFRVTMTSNAGAPKPFATFKSFKFTQRKGEEYSKHILDNIPSMDEILIIHGADAIKAMLEGGDESDDDFDEAPAKASKPVVRDEDDDEPAPARKKRPQDDDEEDAAPKCPVKGGRFGVDIDELEECGDCELANKCSAQYRANSRKSRS